MPLKKWLLANHPMCCSKKGISAHLIHRMLGISYETAWSMCRRIREVMAAAKSEPPIGGVNIVVEVDETFVGGKAMNSA